MELDQKQVTKYIDERNKKFEILLVVEAGGKRQDVKIMEMTAKKRKPQPAP